MKKIRLNRYKEIVIVILLLVFAVSLISVFGLAEKIIDRINNIPDSLHYTDTGKAQFYYGGNKYSLNTNIESILVMGIDSMGSDDYDSYQADFIALLIINKLEHSFSVLHINRDTMTQITQLDESGRKYGEFEAQIALAHTYGGDDKTRCRNTVATTENLLYNTSIDHYISFTMDAIPIINDGVGGVTITLNEDLTALGEKFVKGAEITLNGDEALEFVRYRDNEATTSNLSRMERQRQYITALSEQYLSLAEDASAKIVSKIGESMFTDCTANQLSLMLERIQSYTYDGTISLEGEALKPGEYVEYHVDDAALQKTVIDLFYQIEE